MLVNNLDEYYQLIEQLCRDAGKIIVGAKITHIETKSSISDVVTEYDRKIEATIINKLREKYPSHKFIGEENTADNKLTPELTDDPTWIIDPIDGTLNFVHTLQLCCISVALSINKEMVIGIVYNPYHNEFFSARKGQGAFLNGKAIESSKITDLSLALISCEAFLIRIHKKHDYRMRNLLAECQGLRCLGSAALILSYVACGRIDGYEIEYVQPWDIAAGSLIIKEAGGIIKNVDNDSLNIMKPNCVAAGTAALAEQISKICIKSDQQAAAEQ